MRTIATSLAMDLNVRGLMNVQFAIRNEEVYLIEVNPRASRTVPFVSKATGVPLAKIASLVQAGWTLKQLGVVERSRPENIAVKESVLPFNKFPGQDTILGPEMRSTGEVMGIAPTLGEAFYKAELGAGNNMSRGRQVFISVRDNDKRAIIPLAWLVHDLGYQILATSGTAEVLIRAGIPVHTLNKISQGGDTFLTHKSQLAFVINTPNHRGGRNDEGKIRSACAVSGIPAFTTLSAATAVIGGLREEARATFQVRPLQDLLPDKGIYRFPANIRI
jgi:carbamoyl-phosphate synthase large subunit